MEKYIQNGYLLLLDTSFILDARFCDFFHSTYNKLQSYNQKLIIPQEVIKEIQKVKDEKKISKEHYMEVMYLLEEYRKSKELTIVRELAHKNHTDNLFIAKITELRLRKNILLCSNDKNLIRDVNNLNNSLSTYKIKDIKTYSFNNIQNGEKLKQDYLINDISNKIYNYEKVDSSLVDRTPYKTESSELLTNLVLFQKGGEGVVYKKGNNELIKIYHKKEMDKKQEQKLRALKALKSCKNVMFPKEIVYNKDNQFIGYTMDFVKDSETLDSYLRGIIIKKYQPTRLDLVKICIRISEIARDLHSKDIFMGDWNLKNILINPKTFEINFIDTDSFQTKDFPCPVAATGFLDPDFIKLTKGNKLNSYFRNEGNEIFSYCVLIFTILMLGKAPFAGKDNNNIENNEYHFPYRFNSSKEKEPEGMWKFIWHNFSFRTKESFSDTFKHGKKYKIDWWLYILNGYKYNIENGINSNKLIETELKKNSFNILP